MKGFIIMRNIKRAISYFTFCLTVLLSIILVSCGEKNMQIKLSPNEKSIFELTSVVYSIDELNNISQFEGTMKRLNEKYPIECVRETNSGYTITYRGENSFLLIEYDDRNSHLEKVYSKIYSYSFDKSFYDKIDLGSSFDNIKSIDPNGDYDFINMRGYLGSDPPLKSFHVTSDGFLVCFTYDSNLLVVEKNFSFI